MIALRTVEDALVHFDMVADLERGLTLIAGADGPNIMRQLGRWTFITNSRVVSRWGQCSYRNRTIEIHHVLLAFPLDFKHTMLHECAHAIDKLVNGQPSRHGRPWQRIMHQLGVSHNANHSVEAVKVAKALQHQRAKYHWRCQRCDHITPIMRRRKYRPEQYTHAGCGGHYTLV